MAKKAKNPLDEQILSLEQIIKEKEANIKEVGKFPTNGHFDLDGERHNIHTFNAGKAQFYWVKLSALNRENTMLGLPTLMIGAHSIDSLIQHLSMRHQELDNEKQRASLSLMKAKLAELKSEELKAKESIEGIAELLK